MMKSKVYSRFGNIPPYEAKELKETTNLTLTTLYLGCEVNPEYNAEG